MPTPFMCHECDKPTMNASGICDNCESAYRDGNKETLATLKEAENRIERLENGLKEIANGRDDMNPLFLKKIAQAILDGEPTTADAYNIGDDIEYKYESLPTYDIVHGPNDPGDENDNVQLKVGNRITMSENEESVWREQILHLL